MKIRIKNKINFSEADKLIESYYDGLTSVEEEKQLRNFLSQSNLPERYKPEQAIFGYFVGKKMKVQFSLRPYIRWASVAAVLAFVAVTIHFLSTENLPNYAYVDGKKITDVQLVKNLAETSLKEISDKKEQGNAKLDAKELMKAQLNAFSE
ncbi:MAG: hypothetical protein WCJ61_12140 [Paludibacter sp.]